jgi:ATPase family associated with various cellular activities (AAA)
MTTQADSSFSISSNHTIEKEIEWCKLIYTNSIGHSPKEEFLNEIADQDSFYASEIKRLQLSWQERFALILAIAPYFDPEFLREISEENEGLSNTPVREMKIATGETAIQILSKNDPQKRFKLLGFFSSDHIFARQSILQLSPVDSGLPFTMGRLLVHPYFIQELLKDRKSIPSFSSEFPAKQIESKMRWDDLVLSEQTLTELNEVRMALQQNREDPLYLDLQRKRKRGLRALFHGSPGTGKSITACLLAQELKRPILRIDLSQIVSKYIGETEKNLARVMDRAEDSNWILFFDEADAVFGKRTKTSSSNDRFANQEVSYLLQRIEDFNGFVILASNFKNNIDQAFFRRFESIVFFPYPAAAERLLIWKKALPQTIQLNPEVELSLIANRVELTGANILNIVSRIVMHLQARGTVELRNELLIESIRRELGKENRTY